MIKNTFIVVMLLVTVAKWSSAQSGLQDVVYLKDGSILRGNIIAQYADSLVKIEIAGGSVLAVNRKQLDYIEYKVRTVNPAPPERNDTPTVRRQHGYFNVTEMGVLPGSNFAYDYYYGPSTSVGFTVQSIHGYRINPHFLTGAGLAIDFIQYPMGQLFADGRWEILDRKTTPFIFADAGYGIPLASGSSDPSLQVTYHGGFTWGAGAGMRVNFRNEGAFLMEVGYKMIKRSEEYDYDVWGTDKTT
ncbi:MAG: hypothetical protein ABIO46_09855, partial [Chitinophagales bacterium]